MTARRANFKKGPRKTAGAQLTSPTSQPRSRLTDPTSRVSPHRSHLAGPTSQVPNPTSQAPTRALNSQIPAFPFLFPHSPLPYLFLSPPPPTPTPNPFQERSVAVTENKDFSFLTTNGKRNWVAKRKRIVEVSLTQPLMLKAPALAAG
jgi:hypothetical protein